MIFFPGVTTILEVILHSGGKTLFCIEAVFGPACPSPPLLIMPTDVVLNAGHSEVLSTPEGPLV